MKKLLPVILALVLPMPVLADEFNSTTNSNSDLTPSLNRNSAMQLTKEEKSIAKSFMLTDSDWIKYKQLMSGPRGIWSPDLDPITALGVSEEDPRERKRYAEIWIRVEAKRKELELAFERDRMAAALKIFEGAPVIDVSSQVAEWKAKQKQVEKQIVFFVNAECKEACESIVGQLIQSISRNGRLDIYFNPNATNDSIGDWAAYMKIDPNIVTSRKITLNFDDGIRSANFGVDMTNLPQVRVVDLRTGVIETTFHDG